MAVLTDIIRITNKHTYQGQELLNVFYFQIIDGPTGTISFSDMVQGWGIEYEVNILSYMHETCVWDSALFENLSDDIEFFDESYGFAGEATGDSLPAFVSVAVRLNRQTKITRNGSKRFAGYSENANLAGDMNLSQTAIDAMESFCGDPLTFTLTNVNNDDVTLLPIIVGRTKDANGVYQLDLSKINTVTSAVVRPKLSTQNTRKSR